MPTVAFFTLVGTNIHTEQFPHTQLWMGRTEGMGGSWVGHCRFGEHLEEVDNVRKGRGIFEKQSVG